MQGDSFRFEVPVSEVGTDCFSLVIFDGNLYSIGLPFWAKKGIYIRLIGEDMNIYTWRVESDMPQQQTWQLFVDDSRDLWNLKQEKCTEHMRLMRKYPRKTENDLKFRIASNVIARMKQLPVEEVWMDNLKSLVIGVKYTKGYPYRISEREGAGRAGVAVI